MTTAQERRRARRLARAAQGSGAEPVDAAASAVAEPVASIPNRGAVPPAVELPPAPEPVSTEVHPLDADGKYGWVAATAPADSARARRAAAKARDGSARRKRWVPVQARRRPAAVEQRDPDPAPTRETVATVPANEHQPRNGHADVSDAGPASDRARALHPKTRAIRITRVKTNGRRRWSVDFLVRQPDMQLPK